MDDRFGNNSNFFQGAKDIAYEVKRHGRMQDPYRRYEGGGEHAAQDGGYYHSEDPHAQDDADSDATEGHDEDDEIYEGEYQGIPHPDDIKANRMAATQPISDEYRDQADLIAERMKDEEQLAHQYESIIEECGHGRFQWTLFFVLGLALMADGVEVFVVGFVLPVAERDMCMSNSNKGMLGLIVYLGMMVGAFVWGGLADKMGRRYCLIIALSINGVFMIFSSFVQGYGIFLFCRLLSGAGIGGSIPIVFSYFSEFLAREKRGEHLSWLCMFWMVGGIYASVMAWSIIPHYGWGFSMGTSFQFHSWRLFVVVCSLPCLTSLVGLLFVPESPRYLLEIGKHDEAWMILKQIYDTNMRARGHPEAVFTVSHIKTPIQVDEFIEIQSSTGTWFQRWLVRIMTVVKQVWQNMLLCFTPKYRMTTLFLAVVWFTLSFSYYGLTVWFPDMIKYFQNEEYESKLKTFDQERVEDFTFNFTLENQLHREGEYINVRFVGIKFKSVTFEDSLFEECYFEDITSTNTHFRNCTFTATLFYNTGGSMLLSTITCFFLFFGNSESAMIGMQCLFCGVSIAAWNALDVITVELYSTDKRATAFGILNGLSKFGAILGISIFASFVEITKVVPILLASIALVGGALLGLRLPETREQVLM
ncbi:synaptic vesicle glycoprotein 2B-like isoform X2 [Stegostoma tigrinum]|uniref:synaptic vesicle glycoprotein 2B-like isoform X2 n=1 Tax=Stegostoma tigrinum TaxID=3053191 RepID=UPI00202AF48A|nr:synaptic vesicle glycoprotein 2B-like isoform X2 [Stegostoma tigrinum]